MPSRLKRRGGTMQYGLVAEDVTAVPIATLRRPVRPICSQAHKQLKMSAWLVDNCLVSSSFDEQFFARRSSL